MTAFDSDKLYLVTLETLFKAASKPYLTASSASSPRIVVNLELLYFVKQPRPEASTSTTSRPQYPATPEHKLDLQTTSRISIDLSVCSACRGSSLSTFENGCKLGSSCVLRASFREPSGARRRTVLGKTCRDAGS